jgi:hypothetical protein
MLAVERSMFDVHFMNGAAMILPPSNPGLSLDLKEILATCRTIAVVGLSPKPQRPSHQVARYLLQAGFTVIPVNPGHREILGQPCFADLLAIPVRVDLVDIFRRAEEVMPIVEQALHIGARLIWMQEGVVNQAAAARAAEAGATVIMNRCLMKDHQVIRREAASGRR